MPFPLHLLRLFMRAAPLLAEFAPRNARSEAKQEPGVGSVQDTHPLASLGVQLDTAWLLSLFVPRLSAQPLVAAIGEP